MKKLLLLVVALVVAFGCKVKGADVVESFESFTDAKNTWLPTTSPTNPTSYTSTITSLEWTVYQVTSVKNTGKIYMTFKKDVKSYMETTPGIVCNQIEINVGAAGAKGGMSLYVGDEEICQKDVTAAGTYTFDVPVAYQNKATSFKIVNTQKAGQTAGNQICVMSITFKEAQSLSLGDVLVTYGEEMTPVSDGDILEGIVEGTVFTFSAENAESIVVTNSENTTIAQGIATANWMATLTEAEELTVTAKLGDEEKKFTFALEVVEAPKPVLGDIVVTYGDGINVANGTFEGLSVAVGTIFHISAANATHISAERWSDETTVIDVDSDNTSWTFNEVQEMEGLTITATDGVETKTFEFLLEVTEAPKPVLGDIVVTYGDGIQVDEDGEISVEVGTTFTFTAENATNITVESFMESMVVVNEDASSATWTPEFAFAQDGFVVTATNGTDSKDFAFFLTVTEPVVPEDEVWTLVDSMDDLVVGGTYIITNDAGSLAMSNKNQSNYRLTTSVVVNERELTNPSEEVLRLYLEQDGQDFLWKTINYLNTQGEIAQPQVYLNVASGSSNYLNATNPQTGNENRRNTSIAFEGENVLITFVNATFKEEENKRRIFYNNDRFATYSETNTSMGKVKLFKLVVPEPEIPAFDLMEDDATKVAMMSTKGELHVWTVEYDKDGNVVKENGEDVAASVMAKAPAADDKAWTNKVADEGVKYEIEVPTTQGNYLTIRAKSVLNDIHSEELVKNVDASGNVISGVEGVVADDANAPVEYFNLQGVRVAADQPGIYIRRQGSKVEKVSIAR